MNEERLSLFQGQKVRRIVYNNEWWFSVIDVVAILSKSTNPRDYWFRMKQRVKTDEGSELSTLCRQLKIISEDKKLRITDCATTEGLFRIIQSIPSPKAEPFKRWLAKVGYERVKEIEDPELASKRARALYKLKGYNEAWIEKRIRGIAIREELTDEWHKRQINKQREYAILTAEISQATFGMTPSQYKKFKGLTRENLRDHMDDLELIFSMLGEASTTKITRAKDPHGFIENRLTAKRGGKIAGTARKSLELAAGEKVITQNNFLTKPQNGKLVEPTAGMN
ncbi:MAG: Bro-N domain-containing protein [Patescibacteria group bacterium]